MKANVREVETRVAAVSGGTVTIAAGANDGVNAGVNAGEVFEIFKVLGEIRDPQTKEVLDTQVQKIGEMTVTSVRDKVASGTYVGSPRRSTPSRVRNRSRSPWREEPAGVTICGRCFWLYP